MSLCCFQIAPYHTSSIESRCYMIQSLSEVTYTLATVLLCLPSRAPGIMGPAVDTVASVFVAAAGECTRGRVGLRAGRSPREASGECPSPAIRVHLRRFTEEAGRARASNTLTHFGRSAEPTSRRRPWLAEQRPSGRGVDCWHGSD